MIDILYNIGLFISIVVLFFFGAYFWLGGVPNKPIFLNYKCSRRMMGFAMICLGVLYVCLYVFNIRNENPILATVLNLSVYYFVAMPFGFSLISLLDQNYISKRRIIAHLFRFFAFIVYNFVAYNYFTGTALYVLILIAASWFFVEGGIISIKIIKIYRKVNDTFDNNYSEDIQQRVNWIRKASYHAIYFGLSSCILTFLPKEFIVLWIYWGLAYYIYLFHSFMNYMLFFEQVEMAIEKTETQTSFDTFIIARNSILEEVLQYWVKQKKYLQQGITIEELAISLGTNRTYLSAFINQTYCCSFRSWITNLRIEEAKKILLDNPDIPISDVAVLSGFSSISHFSRTFAQVESISPTKWREKLI